MYNIYNIKDPKMRDLIISRVVENTVVQHPSKPLINVVYKKLFDYAESHGDFIYRAFIWDKTLEGHNFWERYADEHT